MKMNQKPFKYTSRQNRSRSIENNNCSSGREYDIFSKKVALKGKKERNLNHNDVNSISSTDNEQDNILRPMPPNLIRKPHFFNIQKEYRNVKCIRCSNSQPQNSGSSQHLLSSQSDPKKSQSQSDKTKKGDGQDESSYEQRKTTVEPKKKEYLNNKDHSFLKDGLYLEAFFYQLAVNGFFRHPITSSSPIISYFLIQLIVAYKQPDQKNILSSIPEDDEMIKYIEQILQDQQSQRYLSLKQFLGQENKNWGSFYQKMIDYGHKILTSLAQESNFNYQLAIDDFIKYQQLVIPKFNEYIEYFRNDKYGKNNLAIGFLRFCFQDVVTEEKIEIRIPIGKFDQDCVINSDIVNLQTIQTYFEKSTYFSISSVIHSEKLMLFWIVLHSSEIKEEVKIQLLQKIQSHTNFQKFYQVWELKQVTVEVTSEKKVCGSCVDMYVNFPTKFLSDQIIPKDDPQIAVCVSEEFELIIVTQYLYNPEVKKEKEVFHYKYNSDNIETHKKRINYYFETQQVGLMTEQYVKNRYTMQNNGLFNQEIDTIVLNNTLFLSSEGVDDSMASIKSQSKSVQSQMRKNNADIYKLLTSMIKLIPWGIKQHLFQSQKKDIQQQQDEQCYQLLKIIIDQQFKNDQLPLEVNLDFLSMFLRQRIVKNASDYRQKIQKCIEYIDGFDDDILSDIFEQRIYDYGDLNILLLLQDYGYFQANCRTLTCKPLTSKELKNSKNKTIFNLGLFQITLVLQDQSQESLQITEKNISNHFFQEFIQNYRLRSLKLESEGKRIIEIIVLIFTFTQLSDIQKQGIEQKLQIDDEKIEIQFHYSYFKRVIIDEIQTYQNEQQLLPYENQCFSRRYQKLNNGNQISLYDMDSEISSQLKYFDWKETQDLQSIIQSIQ